jgi:hypothetical protein
LKQDNTAEKVYESKKKRITKKIFRDMQSMERGLPRKLNFMTSYIIRYQKKVINKAENIVF